VVVGVCTQHTEFVAQHFELHLDVGAILLGEEDGKPCLNLGLLV
jgi:hypothetical protein